MKLQQQLKVSTYLANFGRFFQTLATFSGHTVRPLTSSMVVDFSEAVSGGCGWPGCAAVVVAAAFPFLAFKWPLKKWRPDPRLDLKQCDQIGRIDKVWANFFVPKMS